MICKTHRKLLDQVCRPNRHMCADDRFSWRKLATQQAPHVQG
jgi:hypothetical protein